MRLRKSSGPRECGKEDRRRSDVKSNGVDRRQPKRIERLRDELAHRLRREQVVAGLRPPERPHAPVADDHAGIMTAICRLLALDCEVVGTVTDGKQLLEAAQRLQPDAIVLDVNLPHVNGLDACRQMTRENPEIRVIVFTAMTDPDIKEHALAAGASAFVSKLAGAGTNCSRPSHACVTTGSLRAIRGQRSPSTRPRPPAAR